MLALKTLYKYDAGMVDGVLYLTDPNGESKHLGRFKWGAYADSYDILVLRDTDFESELHCNQIKDQSLKSKNIVAKVIPTVAEVTPLAIMIGSDIVILCVEDQASPAGFINKARSG